MSKNEIRKKTDQGGKHDARPEIYAVSDKAGGWEFSRRDFLKISMSVAAAGIAAGVGHGVQAAESEGETQLSGTPATAHPGSVNRILVSPDGAYMVSTSDDAEKTVRVWTLPYGGLIVTLSGENPVLSPDGSFLALSKPSGEIELRRMPDGAVIKTLVGQHTDAITSMAINADGTMLVSAGNDGKICMWNPQRYTLIKKLEGQADFISTLLIGPEGEFLAAADREKIKFWLLLPDAEINEPLLEVTAHNSYITSLNYDPAERMFVTSGFMQKTLRMWNLSEDLTAEPGLGLKTLAGHRYPIQGASMTADGQLLATGDDRGYIHLWSLGKKVRISMNKGHDQGITFLAFSADGGLLATGSQEGVIKLWSVSAQEMTLTQTLELHTADVNALAFDPASGFLASGSNDQNIGIWTLPDGELAAEPADVGLDERIVYTFTSSMGIVLRCTLPPDATMPEGVRCTCDTVTGVLCSCEGYCACDTECGCVGDCGCDGHCGCDSECSCVGDCGCDGHCASDCPSDCPADR